MKMTEEARRKISIGNKGKKRSEETRKKLSESKRGPKNPMWKGDLASPEASRQRARRLLNTPKGIDTHHIDGNPYNNDSSNLKPLDRRGHMIMDGRLNNLIIRNHNGALLKIDDHDKFMELYNSGLIDSEIAPIFNTNRRVICSYRKKHNLSKNGKGRRKEGIIIEEIIQNTIQQFPFGISISGITDILNNENHKCSYDTIYKHIKNLERMNLVEYIKYSDISHISYPLKKHDYCSPFWIIKKIEVV